jgi:hypothetical protein
VEDLKVDAKSVNKKNQLLARIIELNRALGSDVTEAFYKEYSLDTLELELEILEKLVDEESC